MVLYKMKRIIKILMEFHKACDDMFDYQDDPPIPKYYKKVVYIADKIGFDTDYSEEEMIKIIEKNLPLLIDTA